MNINIILATTILFFTISACKNEKTSVNYIDLHGKTMGTTYNIKYKSTINLKKEIDDELVRINNQLSTYIKSSTISKFNQSDTGIIINKGDLWISIVNAKNIFELSNGFYDPTIMPLINYWGFGYTGHNKRENIDSVVIDSILEFIGFDKINIINQGHGNIYLKKENSKVQIDLSSIAKGYGVDKIGEILKSKNINNYLVEIGGELSCSGLSPSNKEWTIGVNTPSYNLSVSEFIIQKKLSNKAMATSGNYRNYYNVKGKKYGHTINPKSGFPESSNLLSATIITNNCMTADALATACMVSGLTWSKNMINKIDSIDGILIFSNMDNEMEVWKKNSTQ